MTTSGISPSFLGLSRSSGQVTHVLLTRSRLCPRPKPGSSLHLHVLSTPPAFVLSQDQTLRERVSSHPRARPIRTSKGRARGSSVMKSVNADIPALAHMERRTLTEICAIAGANPVDGVKLGRVPAEAGAHMLFSFQRPSALSGVLQVWAKTRPLVRRGPLASRALAATGSRRLRIFEPSLLPVPLEATSEYSALSRTLPLNSRLKRRFRRSSGEAV